MRLQCRVVFAILLFAFALTGSSVLGQSAPIAPPHPVTVDQVRQLMTVTHSIERMKEGITRTIAQQKSAMPAIPDAFWSEFQTEFMKLDWIAIATPIYQKYLSQEDAEKAISFYKTEAGQHSLDSAMAVYEEMSKAGFDQGKAIGMRLGDKYKDQILENTRKLQENSPAVPAPR